MAVHKRTLTNRAVAALRVERDMSIGTVTSPDSGFGSIPAAARSTSPRRGSPTRRSSG